MKKGGLLDEKMELGIQPMRAKHLINNNLKQR